MSEYWDIGVLRCQNTGIRVLGCQVTEILEY